MVFLVLFWIFLVILPIPFSALFWYSSIFLWLIFILKWSKIKFIQKIRKATFYLIKNFWDTKVRKRKVSYIKKNIKKIIK